MSDKVATTVSFRPKGPLAERTELMKELNVNQSELFNSLLSKPEVLRALDVIIDSRKRELKKLLQLTA
jgi:hypothetical protein